MTQIQKFTRIPFATGLTMALLGSPAFAQRSLEDLMRYHGISLPERGLEGAFDDGEEAILAPTAGTFAAPLAMLTAPGGRDRIAAAYAFGILAGRGGTEAAPAERDAAVKALLQMAASDDRKARIAGARVAGRLLAAPLDEAPVPAPPAGWVDTLFSLMNRDNESEQLAAMDALGRLREVRAVPALTERYFFYRDERKRALAGGALEALARIGDPSSAAVVKLLAGDPWAEGRDATALAVAFARERLLKDGSVVTIQLALGDMARQGQARWYLAELGVPVQ